MADPLDTGLEAELRELGRRLDVPPAPDVADAVRAQLAGPEDDAPATPRRPLTRRPRPRHLAAAAVVLLAAVVVGTPMGRAAVVEVLRFAGVEVRQEPRPTPRPTGPGMLPGETRTSLEEARRRAAFPVYVPEALGRPEAVTVSDGDPPRVVSLLYRDGRVRLDEFDGRPSPYFEKFAGRADAKMVRIGDRRALWVRGPHEVVYADRTGRTRTGSARLAANTLVWQTDGVTLRLEGDFAPNRAIAVARSVSPE
ncbi:MAG: hypothetical protein GEV03_12930 [Streptosporangiales bacterium]|nr:hypothetical protein [Streptosporangiales bacterium]